MRYAIIQNNTVVNIAVADPDYAAEQGWVELPEGVGIGWSFDGVTAIPPARDLESEWAQIRAQRDELLAKSDKAVLPDRWAAMSSDQQQAWSLYRQALRDVPETYSDPKNVVWPSAPTA